MSKRDTVPNQAKEMNNNIEWTQQNIQHCIFESKWNIYEPAHWVTFTHARVSLPSPEHGAPLGALVSPGYVQARDLDSVPSPHVTEHTLHDVHEAQTPSTVKHHLQYKRNIFTWNTQNKITWDKITLLSTGNMIESNPEKLPTRTNLVPPFRHFNILWKIHTHQFCRWGLLSSLSKLNMSFCPPCPKQH